MASKKKASKKKATKKTTATKKASKKKATTKKPTTTVQKKTPATKAAVSAKKKTAVPTKTSTAGHPEMLPPSPTGGTGVVSQAPPGFGFANPRTSPDDFNAMDPKDILADTKAKASGKLQPIPTVRQPETLSLDQVIGSEAVGRITATQSITFHTVGDTGGIKEPSKQFAVADALVNDLFEKTYETGRAAFFYHLGDVVYYLGQDQYYYEQFYDPYRDYDAPIFAIPGNHDGMISATVKQTTLDGFLDNFCDTAPKHNNHAHGMTRTTMIQPGAYFTLNAPFVKFIGLYSNIAEGTTQGTISGHTVGTAQLTFLNEQLQQAAAQREQGKEPFALILAVHHPPFTGSKEHAPSPEMLTQIDQACDTAKIQPDLVLSGHAHLYERYTRYRNGQQIPYVVAGMGGYFNLSGFKKAKKGTTVAQPKPPLTGTDAKGNKLVLETYNDQTFGFLRITVTASTVKATCLGVNLQTIAVSPLDSFTINLKSHTVTKPQPAAVTANDRRG